MVKINILGTEYTIIEGNEEKYPKLKERCGYFDETIKVIVVDDFIKDAKDPSSKDNLTKFKHKVIRHEIIHAFLYESGLSVNSNNGWAMNEELVDWLAIQMPKIFNECNQINILE